MRGQFDVAARCRAPFMASQTLARRAWSTGRTSATRSPGGRSCAAAASHCSRTFQITRVIVDQFLKGQAHARQGGFGGANATGPVRRRDGSRRTGSDALRVFPIPPWRPLPRVLRQVGSFSVASLRMRARPTRPARAVGARQTLGLADQRLFELGNLYICFHGYLQVQDSRFIAQVITVYHLHLVPLSCSYFNASGPSTAWTTSSTAGA